LPVTSDLSEGGLGRSSFIFGKYAFLGCKTGGFVLVFSLEALIINKLRIFWLRFRLVSRWFPFGIRAVSRRYPDGSPLVPFGTPLVPFSGCFLGKEMG